MKILMVIPALGDVYGGTTKIVIELAESVAKLGVNVDIVATNANGSTTLDVPLNKWITEKKYRVQYFSYFNFLDYKFTLSMTRWLFHNVCDYDIVHTNAIFSYPVLAAHLACRFRIVPYIATPHGMMEPWALAYKGWKKKFYFSFFENPLLQKANAIQMTASTEARHISTLDLKTPLVFVSNGINSTDFESLPNPELFYEQFSNTRNKILIIFLGRIDPKKGLDLLATAFAKAHEKFPETHLIVAGPDNTGFLPTAESYFSEAGCKDAVTFTGMLTGPIKYAALAAANIYVAPSYSEGFSMSVLEGMATGLPCVITTGCNFPEAAESQAASVVDINADQIANALISLLQDPIQAKNMGDRARKFILENYTWDSVASKLISVYQDIIRKTDKNPVSLERGVSR
ncbi:MAG: glycosyltransferase [Nostoc sp.]|uniref:glycosyltransferase n=1 Tax=Nostoc sp. TaxID=1180 RepID=UPI002FFB4A2C